MEAGFANTIRKNIRVKSAVEVKFATIAKEEANVKNVMVVPFANIIEEESHVKNAREVTFAGIRSNWISAQIATVQGYANLGKNHIIQDVDHMVIES